MDLSDLAIPGTILRLRVTPGARAETVERDADGLLRIKVTAPPEDGRANKAVLKVLAQALGVAPSRLTLVRGETGRDKLVRLEN